MALKQSYSVQLGKQMICDEVDSPFTLSVYEGSRDKISEFLLTNE